MSFHKSCLEKTLFDPLLFNNMQFKEVRLQKDLHCMSLYRFVSKPKLRLALNQLNQVPLGRL